MDLELIKTAMASAIAGMTKTGGYQYNWNLGTVNPVDSDWNRVLDTAYPIADIYNPGEVCENPEANTLTVTNVATFLIDVVPNKGTVTSASVEKCVRDIKRICGQNPSLTGACFFWWYEKFDKFTDQMHPKEYGARVTVKVRYMQNRLNP